MLEYYKTKIDRAISALSFPDQPADLYDPIRYILQLGGKRIRPLLVLLAADLFGEDKVDQAMPAALAIELFHNFTLMHDDIMDEAPLRRGMPTVHHKWNDAVAILAGDKLMVRAYAELAKCDPERLPQLLNTFNQVAREVCEGQQWDMQYEREEMINEADYIEMIRLKTAVLLGCGLKMGAIIGGASGHDSDCLYTFGINLGIAFQLQDDMLDVYGESAHIGKQIGGDILANKKTILLVTAYSLGEETDRRELLMYLSADIDPDTASAQEKIRRVRALYDHLQVLPYVTRQKEQYVARAFDSLDRIEAGRERLQHLRNLAQSLLTRTS